MTKTNSSGMLQICLLTILDGLQGNDHHGNSQFLWQIYHFYYRIITWKQKLVFRSVLLILISKAWLSTCYSFYVVTMQGGVCKTVQKWNIVVERVLPMGSSTTIISTASLIRKGCCQGVYEFVDHLVLQILWYLALRCLNIPAVVITWQHFLFSARSRRALHAYYACKDQLQKQTTTFRTYS